TSGTRQFVTGLDLLPWVFADAGESYTGMQVSQWSWATKAGQFQAEQSALDPTGIPMEVESGSAGADCGWLTVRDGSGRGLFAGWEFDGRALATARHMASKAYVKLTSRVEDLHHPVEADADFTTPAAFLGVFHGDFDESAFNTQRFAEAVLAKL